MDERLQRLLGGDALAPLRQRLRRHFERGDDGQAGAFLQLAQLEVHEHAALAQLSGRPSRPARSARVDVAAIDAALQAAGVAPSLRAALEQLDGPITSRAALQAARDAVWMTVLAAPGRHPLLQSWLSTSSAVGLVKRLTRQDTAAAETLLAQATAVMCCLPAAGVTRAQLAAQTLGNAHALDAGRPVASLVLAVWRHVEAATTSSLANGPSALEMSLDKDSPESVEKVVGNSPQVAERARDIWARAGILVNELARPVLMLNLPVKHPAAGHGPPGEPAYLSLRQLLRTPPTWSVEGRTVFVCENPNLLAIAADRLGVQCAPLVCIDGMPAAAQRTLLDQLLHAGARLHYHGDFDWPGLQIANHVMRVWQAQPWRMASTDYEAAVKTAPHIRRDITEIGITAAWDPQLSMTMHHHGLSIAEEAVADSLIEDLHHIT